MKRIVLTAVAVIGIAGPAWALERTNSVKVTCGRASHKYRLDEAAEFDVTSDVTGQPVRVSFLRGYLPIKSFDTTTPVRVSHRLGEPGFIVCKVQALDSKGPFGPDARAGAGFEPSRIRTALPPSKDYDAFWDSAFAEQAAIASDFTVRPLSNDVQLVSCRTVQGMRMYGFLYIPKGKGPFPLQVNVGGGDSVRCVEAEVGKARDGRFANRAFLDIHLPPWEPSAWSRKEASEAHNRWKKENNTTSLYRWNGEKPPRERWYYRCILGSCRLVEYAAQRPGIDPARVYYTGASTGGGYGVFLAAFSPYIRAAICEVPNYGNAGGPSVGRPSGEDDRGEHWQTSLYYDSAYCAPRITCPVFMSCGYLDNYCTPETVYCIYNELKCRKVMYDKVENGHGDRPRGYDAERDAWLEKTLAKLSSPPLPCPMGAGASGATRLVYEKKGGVPTKEEFTIPKDRTFYVECLYSLSENLDYKHRTKDIVVTNGRRREALPFDRVDNWTFRKNKTARPCEYGLCYEPTVRSFCWWRNSHKQAVKVMPAEDDVGDWWFETVLQPTGVTMKVTYFRVYFPAYEIQAKVPPALAPVSDPKLPKGAALLGYANCLFDETPKKSEISPEKKRCGKYKWYSGLWYTKMQPMALYADDADALVLTAQGKDEGGGHGMLSSAPADWKNIGDAQLPFLDGGKGFYVEWEVSLSDNDPDHYLQLWLMPVNKINGSMPHYEGDPVGDGWKMERWMELDVEESGFGTGLLGTVHNQWGFGHPNYCHVYNGNHIVRNRPLDRTRRIRYGASYDPVTLTVRWYVDDEELIKAEYPNVPTIAREQKYYLIMGAVQHKKKVPYKMYVHRVRAYTR